MKIKELKIFASRLTDQIEFYSKVLGIKQIDQNENSASFQIGESILTFTSSPNFKPYHFAINIPSNKEKEALDWLKEKVGILKNGLHEIQDFDFWNAMAIYFYDADKNIVEFIARKNLSINAENQFNSNQLIEISEIGLPTNNIEKEFKYLNAVSGIEIYSGDFNRFCAIGDEHGLFICIDKRIKKWFPTNELAYSADFEIKFESNQNIYQFSFENGKLNVLG